MNNSNRNLPTTCLELFQHHYKEEPFRIHKDGSLTYRGIPDIDEARSKAKGIIEKHGLNVRLHSDSGLVQMKMFTIIEI